MTLADKRSELKRVGDQCCIPIASPARFLHAKLYYFGRQVQQTEEGGWSMSRCRRPVSVAKVCTCISIASPTRDISAQIYLYFFLFFFLKPVNLVAMHNVENKKGEKNSPAFITCACRVFLWGPHRLLSSLFSCSDVTSLFYIFGLFILNSISLPMSAWLTICMNYTLHRIKILVVNA